MRIVVDASALVAIAKGEPEAAAMEAVLSISEPWASSVNIMEAGLALVLRDGRFTAEEFGAWLADFFIGELDVRSADAIAAYLAYGKGVHRASLNLGDCFAYALAKQLDAPLLYKGDDFPLTDVRSALQPT